VILDGQAKDNIQIYGAVDDSFTRCGYEILSCRDFVFSLHYLENPQDLQISSRARIELDSSQRAPQITASWKDIGPCSLQGSRWLPISSKKSDIFKEVEGSHS